MTTLDGLLLVTASGLSGIIVGYLIDLASRGLPPMMAALIREIKWLTWHRLRRLSAQ